MGFVYYSLKCLGGVNKKTKTCVLLLVGATEESQVVLVDVLGDVKAIGLNQLLVISQLILKNTDDFS